MTAWLNLFSRSPKARLAWRSRTGRAMRSYSETRWWSKWEIINQIVDQFGDVQPFLEENTNTAPATASKALAIVCDHQKSMFLQVELAITVDVCRPFIEATYKLEGDGPLILYCYEVLNTLVHSIRTRHYSNTSAVIKKICQGLAQSVHDQWMQYAIACMQPGLDYFVQKFDHDLYNVVQAFKSARLFFPPKVIEIMPDAAQVDTLKLFPFLNNVQVLDALKTELPAYLSHASDVSSEIDPLKWWHDHSSGLPHWSNAVRQVIAIQPSSAASERVFSLLNNTFSSQQDASLQDYIEASLMLQFNKS